MHAEGAEESSQCKAEYADCAQNQCECDVYSDLRMLTPQLDGAFADAHGKLLATFPILVTANRLLA